MINNKNKSLFLRIGAVFLATLFGVLMIFMPFMFNKNEKHSNLIVEADTITSNNSFDGSDLYFPLTLWDVWQNGLHINAWCRLSFNFADMRGFAANGDYHYSVSFYTLFSYNGFQYRINSLAYPSNPTADFSTFDTWFQPNIKFKVYDISSQDELTTGRFDSWLYVDSLFDFAPKSVTMSYVANNNNAFSYEFDFLDAQSHALKITIFNNFSIAVNPSDFVGYASSTFFPSRTYFLSQDSMTDNAYYLQGRSDGYNSGLSVGDSQGYQRGYNAGYSVGERSGFNDGVTSANDYSFLGLFGAIVDAPLKAFTGLFDFNLSFDGVHNFNLKGFFLAMLSIAIVVAIIRFAMSR